MLLGHDVICGTASVGFFHFSSPISQLRCSFLVEPKCCAMYGSLRSVQVLVGNREHCTFMEFHVDSGRVSVVSSSFIYGIEFIEFHHVSAVPN